MGKAAHSLVTEKYITEHFDEALAKKWIQVYFQPVVRASSRQVCGMEALARWEDPEYGLLTPASFIAVLEKHRRIHELDTYVLNRVCESLRKKKDRIFVPVSVNLSRLDYELCDIFNIVEAAVQTNKVPRSYLCIELTESVLANNEALMHQYIDRFHRAGYAVWMDDFGSGYSSLNVLKDFEFDELKIDMHFLSDFHPRSKRILASIVNMAKHINIQTLAEGVETEEQFEFLRNIGCEKIQGFLIGRPMPYQECLKHLSENGLAFESPRLRHYYDELGSLNVLSATPFQFASEKAVPVTGRELNSIPLAVVELNGDAVELLFANRAFEKTTPAVDWQLLRNSSALDGLPIDRLSRRLSRLLDEARQEGEGTLLTVHNDDYYEMRAKRIAQSGSRCSILMGITNLSQIAALDNQKKLDDGLRSLYSVYEQVSVIDLDSMTLTPLHRSGDGEHNVLSGSLSERIKEYAESHIFPEDQRRYLRFMNTDTLEERITRAGSGSLTIHLRTLTMHGAYDWKCYLLVRIHDKAFYLLVRDAQGEVREFRSASHIQSGMDDSSITAEVLWNNVVNHSSLKFFWKDKNRRFLGASRSFLDYYEFSNTDAIIGRTDEDMGWHIHPDLYQNEEQHVLKEGKNSVQVEGTCLARGENRDIIASKMPLYSDDGEIVGLIGYFFQADNLISDRAGKKSSRTDDLTGLLNTHGIYEDLYNYIDEYQLRGKDFARIEVSIEDIAGINARYGFDFGDAVIRETGIALRRCCRNSATVGRMIGSLFTVLYQYDDRRELEELIERIRLIPTQLREVNDIPFTMFLSLGTAIYSDSENKDVMASQAELRRLTDDVTGISQSQLMDNSRRIFQMYDDLPLAYAVYKVITDSDGVDAVVLYANREYLRRVNMPAEALIGNCVSKIFPMETDQWMDLAKQAGLEGKTLSRHLYYGSLKLDMIISAHPIIGPGFCAFTYQIMDDLQGL
ncbi:MAG: EAL domain-containing protein [Oscillospiraceae bacterium]|nr:EAL domain-containing protein [Oscillospiraceae bacterium]